MEEAQRIVLAPKGFRIEVTDELRAFAKKRFMGMVFTKGETANLLIFGEPTPFDVMETVPSGRAKVTEKTVIQMLGEPLEE